MERDELRRLLVGAMATIPTPFDDEYRVDYGRMAEATEHWVQAGLVAGRSALKVAAAKGTTNGRNARVAPGVAKLLPLTSVLPNMPNSWASRHNMTAAQYQSQFDALAERGLFPEKVHVSGKGSNARFTAIWVKDRFERTARHGATSSGYQQQVKDVAQRIQAGEGS